MSVKMNKIGPLMVFGLLSVKAVIADQLVMFKKSLLKVASSFAETTSGLATLDFYEDGQCKCKAEYIFNR